jgi:hypothetical protein
MAASQIIDAVEARDYRCILATRGGHWDGRQGRNDRVAYDRIANDRIATAGMVAEMAVHPARIAVGPDARMIYSSQC